MLQVGFRCDQFNVITLRPQPDGRLVGDFLVESTRGCFSKSTVTFTRTGDVDVTSLPGPASQPPRVVSPAEALHGQYHETTTFSDGAELEYDYAVHTDCLRTGDRCMSYFHNPDGVSALVFGGGNWTYDREWDSKCLSDGRMSHTKDTSQYPLPSPPQDPSRCSPGTVTGKTACPPASVVISTTSLYGPVIDARPVDHRAAFIKPIE